MGEWDESRIIFVQSFWLFMYGENMYRCTRKSTVIKALKMDNHGDFSTERQSRWGDVYGI